ncbi:hypothetical protein BZG36_01853 [Bifiguratus adelaidae]|uniref:Uncharacterized protein n=1 Tax=Bifiguratus adelaidae TaxID=1938954 RepID=A0A261Y2K3_9FUNG|nr:hypothetical protein BZG36_01853 [Bifiguratus adelaidae]
MNHHSFHLSSATLNTPMILHPFAGSTLEPLGAPMTLYPSYRTSILPFLDSEDSDSRFHLSPASPASPTTEYHTTACRVCAVYPKLEPTRRTPALRRKGKPAHINIPTYFGRCEPAQEDQVYSDWSLGEGEEVSNDRGFGDVPPWIRERML